MTRLESDKRQEIVIKVEGPDDVPAASLVHALGLAGIAASYVSSPGTAVMRACLGGDPRLEDVFKPPMRLGALADRVLEWQARRSGPQTIHEIAGCQLDAAHCMWRTGHGAETRLTEKERDVLVYLLGREEHYADRKDLLDHVWGYVQDVQTHTLETHIYRLRQKIEPDPARPSVLVTEREGYRLVR